MDLSRLLAVEFATGRYQARFSQKPWVAAQGFCFSTICVAFPIYMMVFSADPNPQMIDFMAVSTRNCPNPSSLVLGLLRLQFSLNKYVKLLGPFHALLGILREPHAYNTIACGDLHNLLFPTTNH